MSDKDLVGLSHGFAEAVPEAGQKLASARESVLQLAKRIEKLVTEINHLGDCSDEDFPAEAHRQKVELEKALRQAVFNRQIFEARVAALENDVQT